MSKELQKDRIPWRFMLPLVLSTMLNPLNSTMLATALITLCSSLKISVGEGAVLITSLYVTATVAQPLMGRLADIYSPRKINTIGFYLVLLASVLGIAAPNLGWLIVSRVVLGIGTSAAYPSAIALINKEYAGKNRTVPGNILGIVAVSSQVSMILGPTLGGLLSQAFGWRGILFINIPWVIAGLLLSRGIPDFPVEKANRSKCFVEMVDLVGVLLFTSFLLAMLYVLTEHHFLMFSAAGATMLFGSLIFWEWHQKQPFIDIRLLVGKPALSLVYVRTLATNYILYILLNAVPQWIQTVKHIGPARSGLIMLPMTAMAIGVGLLVSRINRPVMQNVLGVTVMLVACAGVISFKESMSVLAVTGFLLIVGIADGINMIANQSLLDREAPLEQKGVSFGLYRTAGYIGAILAGSQLKVIFHQGVTDRAFHHIGYFALISGFILLLLLIPLFILKTPSAGKGYRGAVS
ncbi:MFS transporter [Mucilaginibacter paludis]|uniref:Major facilitator superfamily MFS_1 n=1 Tax=Mucilaginibacter paludis DSM 18603 TaxID=714943 RepID=H1Y6A0_9SPHI|nr:MFS transporter [Mucilaginibacter paludis]EHQ24848.1 major facilitator superfamily MFS_1 [Mucilaginibacter paludis DSM 18603]